MQGNKKKVLLVGQISPTTTVIFKTCSLLNHINLYYVDINCQSAGCFNGLLGDFCWLEYKNDWLEAVKNFSASCEEIYVVCVSYDVARRIYELEKSNIKMMYASLAVIEIAQSKKLQNGYAQQAGFHLLNTHYSNEIGFDPEQYKYPLVVRPVSEQNAADFKVEIVYKADELKTLATKCDIVAQTFARGMKVVIHASRCSSGAISQFHFSIPISYAGFTVRMDRCDLISQLVKPVETMLELIDYVGVCHFEVIEEDGQFYFLDLNLRLGGTTGKVAKLGYNEFFELLRINHIAAESITLWTASHHQRTVVSKIALIKAIVALFRGQWKQTDYPHLQGYKLFSCLLKNIIAGSDEIYSAGNAKVASYFLFDYISRFLNLIKSK